jgi:hypothetical protein
MEEIAQGCYALSSTFEHWNHGIASHLAWLDVCVSSVGRGVAPH